MLKVSERNLAILSVYYRDVKTPTDKCFRLFMKHHFHGDVPKDYGDQRIQDSINETLFKYISDDEL
ncbi:hypothetical protein [Bdellovibrio svalbardensis]|uniref:Uncharacterized protein n=1 Tax=Bdellovibrio svalbardensis TaxID=2972972 RepID=A0ABT6DJQ1_9BACT|nr:hypothetical protein [Bdellovibrio svalbardensis]MDG0816076.1 hypothetical protein [Bdellovibrio svalbardensis]